jgi:hypothetical protein
LRRVFGEETRSDWNHSVKGHKTEQRLPRCAESLDRTGQSLYVKDNMTI